MNPQEEEAFQNLLKYYNIESKFLLRIKLLRQWFIHSIASYIPIPQIIVSLHRLRGVKIGENVYIGNHVHIDLFHPQLITIEDNVSIGMRTMIFGHASHWSPFLKRDFPTKLAPVLLRKGCWIAPGCIILPGVTIGENSIVGAGAVVTKSVDPYTVVAGNPAKLLRTINK